MIQLWVNLPAKHKMHAPRYQPLFKKDIPVVPINADKDGTLRVIAGTFNGTAGPALTFTPINVWEAEISQTGKWIDIQVTSIPNRDTNPNPSPNPKTHFRSLKAITASSSSSVAR